MIRFVLGVALGLFLGTMYRLQFEPTAEQLVGKTVLALAGHHVGKVGNVRATRNGLCDVWFEMTPDCLLSTGLYLPVDLRKVGGRDA